uniref:Uncharacterized protein n=1 Tax=Rhizophora mucronata TaxID=61149 RepID=A0A2P2Q9R7_RHIMU
MSNLATIYREMHMADQLAWISKIISSFLSKLMHFLQPKIEIKESNHHLFFPTSIWCQNTI